MQLNSSVHKACLLNCLNFADSPYVVVATNSSIPEAKGIQMEAFRRPPNNGACGGDVVEKRTAALLENAFYMDDEANFGMPGLLASMAEGMMLQPPRCMGDGYNGDDMEFGADVSLWN